MAVDIRPLPASYRSIPRRLRPSHRPVFDDWPPEREDAEIAIALIEALDDESAAWYATLLARLRALVAGA